MGLFKNMVMGKPEVMALSITVFLGKILANDEPMDFGLS